MRCEYGYIYTHTSILYTYFVMLQCISKSRTWERARARDPKGQHHPIDNSSPRSASLHQMQQFGALTK